MGKKRNAIALGAGGSDVGYKKYRLAVIRAIAADDELSTLLVLKGGNALALVHSIGARSSQDVDYSLVDPARFEFTSVEKRLGAALSTEFKRLDLTVIDFNLTRKPDRTKSDDACLGYQATFKLANDEILQAPKRTPPSARALHVGPGSDVTIEIQISRGEYCDALEERDVDGLRVLVYQPSLIAVEKLRALCQQMDEYEFRAYPTPRPRDLYDIAEVLSSRGLRFSASPTVELIQPVFAAKQVPLALLWKLAQYREFHRSGWAVVRDTVAGELREYDEYFQLLLDEVELLKPLGMEDTPS